MALVLDTHPLLQRRFFRTTRRRLEGKEILVFSAREYERTKVHKYSMMEQTYATAKSIAKFVLTFVLLASIVVVGSLVLPEAYAKIFPENSAEVITHTPTPATSDSLLGESTVPAVVEEVQKYEPPFDETLPLGTWISIPTIGVDTQAHPTIDPNEALNTGVWLVPDFGVPGSEDPIIMAAHRFGWQSWWQDDYWRKNSFYLLTETTVGDRIEVIHEQRKWIYEIYSGEENTEITDYDADLILYTCKFLNSPIRYFRYARLVENPEVLPADTVDLPLE